MLEQYTSVISFNHISAAIDKLCSTIDLKSYKNCQFVCYGSFATNSYKQGSDIDILLLHESNELLPIRIQSSYASYPVTVYSLSISDLNNDGREAKYGGFFSGKLLNPHVWINAADSTKELAQSAVAKFIFPYLNLASKRRNLAITSKHNIGSDVILGYMHLCPWYKNYFSRLFEHVDFPVIWEMMCDNYIKGISQANLFSCQTKLTYVHESPLNLHEETILRAARFWSLGSIMHSYNPHFVDYYISKSGKGKQIDEQDEILYRQINNFLDRKPRSQKEVKLEFDLIF